MSRKFVPVEERWVKFFGWDKDGDPALFFLCVTFIWYKDHCILSWGNKIVRRQDSTGYRAMISGMGR